MWRELLVGCGFSAVCSIASLSAARAQDAAPALTASQQLGRRLFGQDCGVCHTPPTITSKLYGPALSGDLVKGNEPAIADFIRNGDNKMPGFQYYYTSAQIEAIVDYLETVPKPTPSKGQGERAAESAGGE